MPSHDDLLLGESAVMQTVRMDAVNAARSHAKVLLTGETGVGKEVVARLIHQHSPRRQQPFIPVNCGGIPETLLASELFGHTRGSFTGAYRDRIGLVRQADRGTLFLDELGEMSLAMQAVLLRFTETGEIQQVGADGPAGRSDVRFITATNRDLRTQVAAGAFREDLYYRLKVIQIVIPPLRDRGADVLLLLRHYLQEASVVHRVPCPQLTADAEDQLARYHWPGNVRELRNMSERLTLRGSEGPMTRDDLPSEVWSEGSTEAATTPASERAPDPGETVVQGLWDQLRAGENFWRLVQQPFNAQAVSKADLLALIDRGLQETHGSYRALVRLFNLAPSEYKRFHAFLYQQNCNLPVGPYRSSVSVAPMRAIAAETQ